MPDDDRLERSATELLQRLIRFNTVNPPGNEAAAQGFLSELLADAGFDCELLSAVDGRPNLIARLGGDGPRLAYLGHIDTVLADADDWSVDPWSGELRDGCVWGRGALDMKGQVAAEVAAACALAQEGWRPDAGELLVIVTADEEAGGACGAKWLCETVPEKVRCDYLVNEGGGPSFDFEGRRIYNACVAEKGVFRLTITTRGRAGHASMPRIGDNALTRMAPIIEALGSRRAPLEPSPETEGFVQALGLDGDLADALAHVEKVDVRLAVVLEPALMVTFTPTMIHASDKVNVIPARSQLKIDCRVPPGLGADYALERVQELLRDAGEYDVGFDEQVVGNRSAIDSQLMDHIRDFVAREDPDATVVPTVLPAFTDSRWFRETFPDCVAYGFFPQRKMDMFESLPLIHSADERVPVEDLALATRFYAELAPKLLR